MVGKKYLNNGRSYIDSINYKYNIIYADCRNNYVKYINDKNYRNSYMNYLWECIKFLDLYKNDAAGKIKSLSVKGYKNTG